MSQLFKGKTEIIVKQAMFLADNAPNKELFVAYESFGKWDCGVSVHGVTQLKLALPKYKNHKFKVYK